MKHAKYLFVTALVSVLASCATVGGGAYDTPGTDSGCVVIAVGANGDVDQGTHSLNIRSLDKSVNTLAYYRESENVPVEQSFADREARGVVRTLFLPPGQYEIFNFKTFVNGYPSTTTFGPEKDISIRFSVEKKETTYVGEYLVNPVRRKSLWGRMVLVGTFLTVSDQQDRDLRIANAKTSLAQCGKVSKNVVDPSGAGSPLVRARAN